MASPQAPTAPARHHGTVERTRLRNGLRVVLLPDSSAPVVGVAVYYDVGIRSEPEGRTGFAHLFEHLMFQGSASLGKMEHIRYVESSGGWLNGSTRLDFTNYYEALPAPALERALFLEADRMRAPAVTEENLANQIAVVEEEIRVNVHNQPTAGSPGCPCPRCCSRPSRTPTTDTERSRSSRAPRSTTPATSSPTTTHPATPCSPCRVTSTPTRPSRWSSGTSGTSHDAGSRRGRTSPSPRRPPSDARSRSTSTRPRRPSRSPGGPPPPPTSRRPSPCWRSPVCSAPATPHA